MSIHRDAIVHRQAGLGTKRDIGDRANSDQYQFRLDAPAADDDVVVCALRRIGDAVRRTYRAEPAAVASARHDVTAFAAAHGAPEALCGDIALAVSEACTNVVVHAYDEDSGELEVQMLAGEDDLTIVVRDHGTGIQPKPARTEPPALGLGLPLIAALSDAFELRGTAGQGTEVRMTFAYVRDGDPVDENPVSGQVGDDGRWDPGEPPA